MVKIVLKVPGIILIVLVSVAQAQKPSILNSEYVVKHADLILEGRIVSTNRLHQPCMVTVDAIVNPIRFYRGKPAGMEGNPLLVRISSPNTRKDCPKRHFKQAPMPKTLATGKHFIFLLDQVSYKGETFLGFAGALDLAEKDTVSKWIQSETRPPLESSYSVVITRYRKGINIVAVHVLDKGRLSIVVPSNPTYGFPGKTIFHKPLGEEEIATLDSFMASFPLDKVQSRYLKEGCRAEGSTDYEICIGKDCKKTHINCENPEELAALEDKLSQFHPHYQQ